MTHAIHMHEGKQYLLFHVLKQLDMPVLIIVLSILQYYI